MATESMRRKVGKSKGVFGRGYKPPFARRTTARHTQTLSSRAKGGRE